MLDENHFEQISEVLPFLKSDAPQLIRDFKDMAYFAKIPAGRDIFVEGDEVDGIALLITGVVRVFKLGSTGREITLYRFGKGGSCIISANAILHQQEFPASAIVEQDAEAVMIPAEIFSKWVKQYDSWRDFVFNLVSQRLANVMEIIDEVVFQRRDNRMATFLLKESQSKNPIIVTHQEFANEIGTSREVVSRLLEDFEKKGIIHRSRGEIEVINFDELKNYPLV